MPVRHKPASLTELSMKQACQDLARVCHKLQAMSLKGTSYRNALEYAKCVLRPYYSLPGTIRSQMIDLTSTSLYGLVNEGWALFCGPTPMYLLAILLRPDMRRLRINLCCYYGCSHQCTMLEYLATEGTGLESLELSRFALLRLDCKLLRSALQNMRNLRSLTVRNIANDTILEVIGRSCPNLTVLDVTCSRDVTDLGIQQLMIELKFVSHTDAAKRIKSRWTTIDTDSEILSNHRDNYHHHLRNSRHHQNNTWSRIKTILTKLKSKREKMDSTEDIFIDVEERRNEICKSIKVLNVANTSVTQGGILMILAYAPNLESLADYNFVGRAVDRRNNRCICDKVETFSLKQARDTGSTVKRLEILAKACPRLEKLWIFEPRHSPEALKAFDSLTSLSIHDVPTERQWMIDFNNYLRSNGGKLCELHLRFKSFSVPTEIDLREIFVNCPNLVSFEKEGSPVVVWPNDDEEASTMKRLRRVKIDGTVSARVIVEILRLAPGLTSINVNTCNDLTDRDLEILQKSLYEKSLGNKTNDTNDDICKNLECFYVNEAKRVTATCVRNILKYCKNLRQIGNIANWGLKDEEIENIRDIVATNYDDVQMCPAHCPYH